MSNSGRPYLADARPTIAAFLGPIRRVGFVTAASLGDELAYCERARAGLAPIGVTVERIPWDADSRPVLDAVGAIFVGGGNTYALLQRLRESGLLAAIGDRVRAGVPYLGSSAGSNLAGPTILTTNDWNVVGLTAFDALGLVPFNINPHYRESDPAMAPGSETRDDRIAEYHVVNANPVAGIEEETLLWVEAGRATVQGRGRVKYFQRDRPPHWFAAGETLP